MAIDKHRRYHYTGKQCRYKGSVRIQENGTDIGDRYEHRKIVLIEGISTNTRKQHSFEK